MYSSCGAQLFSSHQLQLKYVETFISENGLDGLNTISSYSFRAHPAISHCSHLLLNCRVATNMSHWLKVHSRSFKNYISEKKCFWIFQYCFYYSFTLHYCAIFNSLNSGFFSIPSGCQTVWIQIRPTFCRAWSGSKLFAKVISRWQKSPLAGKEF